MRVFAPAKVNLYLAVGSRRPDGYHDVTTVVHALAFGDTVTITPANVFGFACTPDLGLRPDDNLACRAALAMAEHFSRPLDVSITVEKRIPSGAGLGGASADAAATITGLAELWGIDRDEEALFDIARNLGADVPFFLTGGAALLGGRGDELVTALPSILAPVVLVKPAAPVLTGEAYAAFDRGEPAQSLPVDGVREALEQGDARALGARLFNNMTASSSALVPDITGALRLLSESPGVQGVAMAGSGSAVFGLFSDSASAERAADVAAGAGLWSAATRTFDGGCTVEGTA